MKTFLRLQQGKKTRSAFLLAAVLILSKPMKVENRFSKPNIGGDATIGAFRANAVAAQFSRVVAAQIYGQSDRPYGYALVEVGLSAR